MKKIVILGLGILVLMFLYFIFCSKIHSVVLGKAGYQPAQLTIKKGDSVKFTTTLDYPFWPASDPHPTHIFYSEFDSKVSVKNTDSWQYKFERSGEWTYHDHINPNSRGKIRVVEINPILAIFGKINSLYKIRFEKHDQRFIDRLVNKCKPLVKNNDDFMTCWTEIFSGITKDFGAPEAMRVLREISEKGAVSYADCHNLSELVGEDSYWKYASGNKFTFTDDFSICYAGFLHGFMSEHVSHGQDFLASKELCEISEKISYDMGAQCYQGLGIGLVFYYWGIFDSDTFKISREAIQECSELNGNLDYCVYGVFGGIEHLYLHQHGSDLNVDENDPFSICPSLTSKLYRSYCYGRIASPLLLNFEFDPIKLRQILNKIPDLETRKTIAGRIGYSSSQFYIYTEANDLDILIKNCRLLPSNVINDCMGGVFDSLFLNTNRIESKYKGFSCDSAVLNNGEKEVCIEHKELSNFILNN